MDTTKLKVGQDVFMRNAAKRKGWAGAWGTVVEVTPEGVIVQIDPYCGEELMRFDRDGVACDSSDIDVDRYKNLPIVTGKGNPAPCDRDLDMDRLKKVVAQYDGKTLEGQRAAHYSPDTEFRQTFWENFEALKRYSGYHKIPGAKHGNDNPFRLFPDRGCLIGF